MLDLIFSTLLIAQVEPPEPQWIQVNETATMTQFYDANSFRGRKNYRTVTILVTSKVGEAPMYPTFYIECKSKTKALVTNIYKGDMKTLDRKRLKYPNPNSLAELMVNITCPKVIKK